MIAETAIVVQHLLECASIPVHSSVLLWTRHIIIALVDLESCPDSAESGKIPYYPYSDLLLAIIEV